jgi:hypothetical protein
VGDIVVTTTVEISDPALRLTPGVRASECVIVPRSSLGLSGIRTRRRSILCIASVGDEHSLVVRPWPGKE